MEELEDIRTLKQKWLVPKAVNTSPLAIRCSWQASLISQDPPSPGPQHSLRLLLNTADSSSGLNCPRDGNYFLSQSLTYGDSIPYMQIKSHQSPHLAGDFPKPINFFFNALFQKRNSQTIRPCDGKEQPDACGCISPNCSRSGFIPNLIRLCCSGPKGNHNHFKAWSRPVSPRQSPGNPRAPDGLVTREIHTSTRPKQHTYRRACPSS